MSALLAPLAVLQVSWSDRIDLFLWAILAALVAGAVCPLIGCLLFVRRTSFYGITLPQFATAGVVFGFVVLPWWVEISAVVQIGSMILRSECSASLSTV